MKTKILIPLLLIILVGCSTDYKQISSEVVEGKISAIDTGHYGSRTTSPSIFYVRTVKETKVFSSYELKFIRRLKVGDSIIFVTKVVEKK